MLSFNAILLASLVAAIFAILANAQTIDPNTVSIGTRTTWCNDQKSSCPLLCPQIGGTADPTSNDCDPNTLIWTCLCSNHQTPNISQYSETIPYFECTEASNQCVAACGSGDNACATTCRTAHPCGAQSPKRVNITSTSSGNAAASATASSTNYGNFGGPAAEASASVGSGIGLGRAWNSKGEMMGFAAMLGGLALCFAVFL